MVEKEKKSSFSITEIIVLILVLALIVLGYLFSNTTFFEKYKPVVKIDEDYSFDEKNAIIFSSNYSEDLEVLLNQIKLDYTKINNPVPDFELLHLPKNLKLIEPIERRKKIFLSSILPLVLKANSTILRERADLCNAIKEKNLKKISKIIQKYGLKEKYIEDLNFNKKILSLVDVIPVSMALAQAAVESGWGTSRFSLEGNALFGQWVWNEKLGLKPKEAKNSNAVVRKFDKLLDSVNAYMFNLNTHSSYSGMRSKRYRPCDNNDLIDGFDLVNWLEKYAQTRNEYVKLLRKIIRTNNLNDLDNIKLF